MNSWKIDVEETRLISAKHPDIFVLINDEGKHLYVRTRLDKDLKDCIDLDILTREELLTLGITVEESLLSEEQGFDKEIEESESEPEDKHVPKKYNANDPKDMAEAKRIADERLKYLQSNDPEYLKKQLEEKANEAEDFKAKLEMVAQMQLEKKMDELKIPQADRERIRADPNLITGYEMALPKPKQESPSGSAPLNDKQVYGANKTQGFESVKEMVEALYADKTPENKEILKQLWLKSLSALKNDKNVNLQLPEPEIRDSSERITRMVGKDMDTGSEESEVKKFQRRKKKVDQ